MSTLARLVSRRTLVRGIAAAAGVAILAACGDTATTPTTGASTGTVAPTVAGTGAAATRPGATMAASSVNATTAPAALATTGMTASSAVTAMTAPAAAAPGAVVFVAPPLTKLTTPSKGELRIALGFDFPAKLDALKDTHLTPYGMLETLARQNAQNKLEPWLAERIANVNPTTWRVTLRDAKFWDGAAVTANDVIAAFKKNWEAFPDLKGIISPDTKMTAVDARTVEFVTPQPSGIFPYALSLTSTAIHKPSMAGGTDAAIMTGPYKGTKLVVGSQLDLEPFKDHWAGIPPIAKITMKFVGDPNARILALQSGDTDMLYNFPAEAIKTLGPDIEASATPSGRGGLINLNVSRPFFADRAVREAFALGIDRTVLNSVGLDGKGTPATQMFPAVSGYDTVPLQGTDIARAKQLLDDAGWKPGADGIRAKGADKISFTILSYPGRADLTPYAVSMQSQLKALGFDIKVMEVQDIGAATKDGTFDAAMKSNNTLPTGNPLYEYNRLLIKGGGDNAGNYTNPKIENAVAQMRTELDPAKLRDLSLQVQQVVKEDVPVIFLTVTPITVAFRKGKIKGYVPNPNDSYLIDPTLSVS